MRIILVRPRHDANVGSVCRAMNNFGFNELFIVNPECKLGFEMILYAKRARGLLKKERIVGSLEEAVKGCDLVIGTTGVVNKYRKSIFKKCVSLKELPRKVTKKTCLVFGSEGTGLSKPELAACDLVCFIPTKPEYEVMNLSHAVTVVLYELIRGEQVDCLYEVADRKKVARLKKVFSKIVSKSKKVKDKKKVSAAFASVLSRSAVSDEEIQVLFSIFNELSD
ncbi:MAG: RNA methyltransferase [Candidatus Micrarchaeota archaeon]